MVTVDPGQAELLVRGLASATGTWGERTETQNAVISAVAAHLLGVTTPTAELDPISPDELGSALTDPTMRTRLVHGMVALEIIADPLPQKMNERVERYAGALQIDDGMLAVARDYANGAMSVATGDLLRNSYAIAHATQQAALSDTAAPGPTGAANPELVAKWRALEQCASGSHGRTVWEFYQMRGFTFPGQPGAVNSLLAQHDWVHCLADYGTSAIGEIEVFTFLASAIPDPSGFSYAVIILGLFETCNVQVVPGVATASPGHLSLPGGVTRFVDALRRGLALNLDVMGGVDWFEYADIPLDEVRRKLGVQPKGDEALESGSLSALDPTATFHHSN
jgi:hypothetical protein